MVLMSNGVLEMANLICNIFGKMVKTSSGSHHAPFQCQHSTLTLLGMSLILPCMVVLYKIVPNRITELRHYLLLYLLKEKFGIHPVVHFYLPDELKKKKQVNK